MSEFKKYNEQGNYSPEGKAILELINNLIKQYDFAYHELDCYDMHTCERCDH